MTQPTSGAIPAPSTMDEACFVAHFGAIYEHSPWVARCTWQRGLGREHDAVDALAGALAAEVEAADAEAQLRLIRAHPDLGGRAGLAGELTAESAREQAGAGLDACTPAEYDRLQSLNTAYTETFGFPFVVAVRGLTREDILQAMAQRLENTPEVERRRALDEIHRIARFRLEALAGPAFPLDQPA